MLTTMTYNVANGLAKPEALVALLRDANADIVGLQELAPAQARAIERSLSATYPFQVMHPFGIPGKALLSRFPIQAAELLHLYPGRPDLRAQVSVRGIALSVIVAHPPPPRVRRTGIGIDAATHTQITALVEAATAGGPTLMLGDFNLVRRHQNYRRIARAGLVDAFGAVGTGNGDTLPLRMARWAEGGHPFGRLRLVPMLRVDYVWLSPHLRPLAAWVGPDAGSDHLPVLARLAFEPPAAGDVVNSPPAAGGGRSAVRDDAAPRRRVWTERARSARRPSSGA